MQGGGIFRKLEAERHRQCMLQPGARHDRGLAMLLRKPGKSRSSAADVLKQHLQAFAQGEHRGSIDDILAGCAPMHIARGLSIGPCDVRGQCLDERNGEIAGFRCGLG